MPPPSGSSGWGVSTASLMLVEPRTWAISMTWCYGRRIGKCWAGRGATNSLVVECLRKLICTGTDELRRRQVKFRRSKFRQAETAAARWYGECSQLAHCSIAWQRSHAFVGKIASPNNRRPMGTGRDNPSLSQFIIHPTALPTPHHDASPSGQDGAAKQPRIRGLVFKAHDFCAQPRWLNQNLPGVQGAEVCY